MVKKLNSTGIALTLVIMIVIMVSVLAAAAMTLGYNQKRLSDATVSNRTQGFYYAQAGIVDAQWRIRNNALKNKAGVDVITGDVGSTGSDFTTASFNPKAYCLDLDSDDIHNSNATDNCDVSDEVKINISEVQDIINPPTMPASTIKQVRKIEATGTK